MYAGLHGIMDVLFHYLNSKWRGVFDTSKRGKERGLSQSLEHCSVPYNLDRQKEKREFRGISQQIYKVR